MDQCRIHKAFAGRHLGNGLGLGSGGGRLFSVANRKQVAVNLKQIFCADPTILAVIWPKFKVIGS